MLSFPEFDPLTTASSSELTTAPLGREGINITPMADEKANAEKSCEEAQARPPRLPDLWTTPTQSPTMPISLWISGGSSWV